MRAEKQCIVWVRLKPQGCIVWPGDKSSCCHSGTELNSPLILKGLICAEWAAAPQGRVDVQAPSKRLGKQRPSGKPRPAAGEVLVILAEESGPGLSLSIIYPSDSRGGAPYLQQAPGIKSCAHRRAVEDGSETSLGAGLVQQDLGFFV